MLSDAVAKMLADTVQNGGGTYHAGTSRPFAPFTPGDGYAVAIGGVQMAPATTGAAELVRWANYVTGRYEARFVGTWLDGDVLYVDAVRYFPRPERAAALKLGREMAQLAIFDFAANDSITL